MLMFPGSNVALVTPFTEDGEKIDYDAYAALVEWQIAAGTAGLVPAGCTGEAATLSHEEQKELITFTVKQAAGRAKVIAGTGSNNTAEALRLTAHAAAAGADGVLLITPYYNKPTPEGQYLHYRKLAEEGGLPVMLYNVPGRTGTKMTPETIARLAREVKNVVSIKEACGSVDQVSEIFEQDAAIEVLSGDDMLTLPMMAVGAAGVVSVVGNIVPEWIVKLCAAAAAGDYQEARQWHYKMIALARAMFIESNPLCVKAALGLLGKITPALRLPLCPMTKEGQAKVQAALKTAGLL